MHSVVGCNGYTICRRISGDTGSRPAVHGAGGTDDNGDECLTAVQIPGNPLRSFDISWVNPNRSEYYLGDRSNAGIEVISTATNKWTRR